MNAQQLIDRYLYGKPLQRNERAALAKQLKGAHNASKAISMAKAEAAKACHDWKPAEPTVGWCAIAYTKRKAVWRVLVDGESVKAFEKNQEHEAATHAKRVAVEKNLEYLGKIPDPIEEDVKAEKRQMAA
jgi:hypothetical protein